MEQTVRIHNLIKSTKVLGPGNRAAIWFQGCMRNCPGCMSPDSRTLTAGTVIPVEKLVKFFLSLNDIEGITISGGEPFLQIDALYALVKSIKKNSNLSVIIYTGFTLNELQKMDNEEVNELLNKMVDILIDGEYVDELNDGVALRGSSNQKVNFLSDRYKNCADMYSSKNRNAEIMISDKELFFVGIPEKDTLQTWLKTTDSFKEIPHN